MNVSYPFFGKVNHQLPDLCSQWLLHRSQIEMTQLARLNQLLAAVSESAFYSDRLSGVSLPLESLHQLREIPLLTKSELVSDSPGEPGKVFTLERESYCRFHQTSGTSGHPMPVFDTAQDWNWWLDCWGHVLQAAEVTSRDVAMMAFSFGPFIGFLDRLGCTGTRRSAGDTRRRNVQ